MQTEIQAIVTARIHNGGRVLKANVEQAKADQGLALYYRRFTTPS